MAWKWRRQKDASDRKHGPLSWWWVGLYAVTAVAIGAGATWWAWPPEFPMPPDEKDRISAMAEQTKAETDAIRTGLAAAGGAGAVFTLLLAVRRQRTTEEDSQQQRMTELYTAAVEQLGHDSAAVRLGALYALQRLGQSYPEQRQAVVSVWCAYLRMPFHDPDASNLDEEERAERRQELEVRLTVQRLLREHVHSGPYDGDKLVSPRYWGDELDVDLTGATLYELDLEACEVHPRSNFTGAQFLGFTDFWLASFRGYAPFNDARFRGATRFESASFGDPKAPRPALLMGTHGSALFAGAVFDGNVSFGSAEFHHQASFDRATFVGGVGFHSAKFHAKGAWFDRATFHSTVRFDEATFTYPILLRGAVAPCSNGHVWPKGWKLLPATDLKRPKGGDPNATWGRLVRASESDSKDSSGGAD